jgi:hypothetical protein
MYLKISFNYYYYDDDAMEQKHDLSGGDARERSNRCALPRRSSVLGAGSWRPFWFDHIFCSMIFGRVMANIRHGGGSCTVAFRPFSEVVRCGVCVFLGESKNQSHFFYSCHLFSALMPVLTTLRFFFLFLLAEDVHFR